EDGRENVAETPPVVLPVVTFYVVGLSRQVLSRGRPEHRSGLVFEMYEKLGTQPRGRDLTLFPVRVDVEVQVRLATVASVIAFGDPGSLQDVLADRHPHRVLHQVEISGHRPIAVAVPVIVPGTGCPISEVGVIGPLLIQVDDHSGACRENLGARRMSEVERITLLVRRVISLTYPVPILIPVPLGQ